MNEININPVLIAIAIADTIHSIPSQLFVNKQGIQVRPFRIQNNPITTIFVQEAVFRNLFFLDTLIDKKIRTVEKIAPKRGIRP